MTTTAIITPDARRVDTAASTSVSSINSPVTGSDTASARLRSLPSPPVMDLDELMDGVRDHVLWSSADGTKAVAAVRDLLRALPAASQEHECAERLSLLEDIKAAAAAAQMRETVELRALRAESEAARGVPESRRCLRLGDEVAHAMRISPTLGSRFLGQARVMCESLPHALDALTAGRINEYASAQLVGQVVTLDEPARTAIDERLKREYGNLSTRELAARARGLAYQADPNTALARHEKAITERRVTVRPATDGMSFLTALLPTPQAFACKKALMMAAATENVNSQMPFFYGTPDEQATQQAAWRAEHEHVSDTATATPSESRSETMPRSAAQIEADLLVTRLTGQATATGVPIELTLVMTDDTVFGISRSTLRAIDASDSHDGNDDHDSPGLSVHNTLTDDESDQLRINDEFTADPTHASAWVPGLGPIPAAIARDLLHPRHDPPERRAEHSTGHTQDIGSDSQKSSRERVFLRRVLLDPITGDINAIDTRKRAFTGELRRTLLLRDGVCQTPGCGAPIRHIDHARPYAGGGTTSAANGTGLCIRCNNTKEHPGWRHDRDPVKGTLTVTSPTGLARTSRPPAIIPRL